MMPNMTPVVTKIRILIIKVLKTTTIRTTMILLTNCDKNVSPKPTKISAPVTVNGNPTGELLILP